MALLLRASEVKRWHIVEHQGTPQTVADHSFRVCVLARRLLEVLGRRDQVPQALDYALDHDADEAIWGDTPSPAKPPTPFPIDAPLWKQAVFAADRLEAFMFMERKAIGAYAYRTKNKIADKIHEFPEPVRGALYQVYNEASEQPPMAGDNNDDA